MPELIRRLKFRAVLFGFLVDTSGTLAVSLLLVNALTERGLSEAEIVTRMHGLNGLLLMLIFGLGFTAVGAYVAGRTAREAEVLHGVAVAGAGIILGLLFRDTAVSIWFDIVSLAAMIPAGALGGYLAKEGNAKRKQTESS